MDIMQKSKNEGAIHNGVNRLSLLIPISTKEMAPEDERKAKVDKLCHVNQRFIVRVIRKSDGAELTMAHKTLVLENIPDRTVHPLFKRAGAMWGIINASIHNSYAAISYPFIPTDRLTEKQRREIGKTMIPESVEAGVIPLHAFFDFRYDAKACKIVAAPNMRYSDRCDYIVLLAEDGYVVDEEFMDMKEGKSFLKTSGRPWTHTPSLIFAENYESYDTIAVVRSTEHNYVMRSDERLRNLREAEGGAIPYIASEDISNLPNGWGNKVIGQESVILPQENVSMTKKDKKRNLLAEGAFAVTGAGIGAISITQGVVGIADDALDITGDFVIQEEDSNPLRIECKADVYDINAMHCEPEIIIESLDSISSNAGDIGAMLFDPDHEERIAREPEGIVIDITDTLRCSDMEYLKAHPEVFKQFMVEVLRLLDEKVYPSIYADTECSDDEVLPTTITVAYLGEYDENSEPKRSKDWLTIFDDARAKIAACNEDEFIAVFDKVGKKHIDLEDYEPRDAQARAILDVKIATTDPQIKLSDTYSIKPSRDMDIRAMGVRYLVRVLHKTTGSELLFRDKQRLVKHNGEKFTSPEMSFIPLSDGRLAKPEDFIEVNLDNNKLEIVPNMETLSASDFTVQLIPYQCYFETPANEAGDIFRDSNGDMRSFGDDSDNSGIAEVFTEYPVINQMLRQWAFQWVVTSITSHPTNKNQDHLMVMGERDILELVSRSSATEKDITNV